MGGEDCFSNGKLAKKEANAGAVIDDTYYYGKNVGKSGTESIYYVSGLGEVNATFHTDTNFVVSGSLFDDKILDFAPLTEPDGFDTLIDDGVAGRSYLIGIGGKFEVFVARIGTDGAPESYAVLDGTTVDWGNGTEVSKGEFGAAFAYQSLEGDAELLFAENGGAGGVLGRGVDVRRRLPERLGELRHELAAGGARDRVGRAQLRLDERRRRAGPRRDGPTDDGRGLDGYGRVRGRGRDVVRGLALDVGRAAFILLAECGPTRTGAGDVVVIIVGR